MSVPRQMKTQSQAQFFDLQKNASLNFCTPDDLQKNASINFCTPESSAKGKAGFLLRMRHCSACSVRDPVWKNPLFCPVISFWRISLPISD